MLIFPSPKFGCSTTSANPWISFAGQHGETGVIDIPKGCLEFNVEVSGARKMSEKKCSVLEYISEKIKLIYYSVNIKGLIILCVNIRLNDLSIILSLQTIQCTSRFLWSSLCVTFNPVVVEEIV